MYFSVTIEINITDAEVRLADIRDTTVVSPDNINFPRSVPKKWTNKQHLNTLSFSLGAIYKVYATIPEFGKYEVKSEGKEDKPLSHFVTKFAYGIILGTMRALFKRGKI